MTETVSPARQWALLIGCGLVGWAGCAAIMGLGMSLINLKTTLIIHAIGAPLVFGLISSFYFRFPAAFRPFVAAVGMLAVVVFLDVFLVSLVINKNFEMFRSFIGSWLPFILIFFSVEVTGRLINRAD